MQLNINLTMLVVSITVIASCLPTYAASFDCNDAKMAVEKTICTDEALSTLDDELAAAYIKALATTDDMETLKKQQRRWVTQVRNKCGNAACISSAYKNRINALAGKHVSAGISVDSDTDISGRWAEFKPAAEPFYLDITSGKLRLTCCEAVFYLRSRENNKYVYAVRDSNSCSPFSRDALHMLHVAKDKKGDIQVRFYSGTKGDHLLSIESFRKTTAHGRK